MSQWTQVAVSNGLFDWTFEGGYDNPSLNRASRQGEIIVMQRRTPTGFALVIRPACPAWRKVQRWLMAHPLPPRVVRR